MGMKGRIGWSVDPIAEGVCVSYFWRMKLPIHRHLFVALPLAASALLTSCLTIPYEGTSYSQPSRGGYTTYTALPADYSGDAYYYNNRYYAGGRYEPGTYSYGGRTYDHRYFYNGQYIYGGQYRQQATRNSYQAPVVGLGNPAGYVVYRTLPRDYAGDAYYYNNRYYAGGRYEPGTYTYKGRTYNNRYSHNGQYLYGGEYRTTTRRQYY
jgi:hypothetical protein